MADFDLSIPMVGDVWGSMIQSTYVVLDATDALFFFLETSGTGGIYFASTDDCGGTWTVPDSDMAIHEGDNEYSALSVWYSKWTPNNADNFIYIAWGTDSGAFVAKLDSSGSILTGPTQVPAPIDNVTPWGNFRSHSQIVVTEDGTVYMYMYATTNSDAAMWRSTDDLATQMTLAWQTPDQAISMALQRRSERMLPSPQNANDLIIIAIDVDIENDNRIMYRLWNAGTQDLDEFWTSLGDIESVLAPAGEAMLDAQFRIADRKVFIVALTSAQAATSTIRCISIDADLVVRQLPDVVEPADPDTIRTPRLCIDQLTGALYCSYSSHTNGTPFNEIVKYKRSRSSGNQWSAAITWPLVDVPNIEAIQVPAGNPAFGDGWFQVVWFDDNVKQWRTNSTDTEVIKFGPYTVRETVDGGAEQVVVDCQSAMSSQIGGGAAETVRISKTPYPTTLLKGKEAQATTWMPYAGNTGTIAVGDQLQGALSGATGVVIGFTSNPNMVGLTNVLIAPGPGAGKAFRPNEILNNLTQTGTMTMATSTRAVSKLNVTPTSTIIEDVAI